MGNKQTDKLKRRCLTFFSSVCEASEKNCPEAPITGSNHRWRSSFTPKQSALDSLLSLHLLGLPLSKRRQRANDSLPKASADGLVKMQTAAQIPIRTLDLLNLPTELVLLILDFINLGLWTDSLQVILALRLVNRHLARLLQPRVLECLSISNLKTMTEMVEFFKMPSKAQCLRQVKRLRISRKRVAADEDEVYGQKIGDLLTYLLQAEGSLKEVEIDLRKRDEETSLKGVKDELGLTLSCSESIFSYAPRLTSFKDIIVRLRLDDDGPSQLPQSVIEMQASLRGLDVFDTASTTKLLVERRAKAKWTIGLKVLRIRSKRPILGRFWRGELLEDLEVLVLDKLPARLTHWNEDRNLVNEFENLRRLKVLVIEGLGSDDILDEGYVKWRELFGVKVWRAPKDIDFSLKEIMVRYVFFLSFKLLVLRISMAESSSFLRLHALLGVLMT